MAEILLKVTLNTKTLTPIKILVCLNIKGTVNVN